MKDQYPKQTDSQSLGDIGEITVQLILKKYKWTADIIKSDFGEDIDCNVFIDNERTNYHLRCQVKSTSKDSNYVKTLADGDFSVSIDSTTIRAWLASYFPVLIIIYQDETDECFWCNPVEQILREPEKLNSKKPSIKISRTNHFNLNTKEIIFNEIKSFYSKLLRTSESTMSCSVIPVIMPKYRIAPMKDVLENIGLDFDLNIDISPQNTESLPSWTSVLNNLEIMEHITTIQFSSEMIEIEDFINKLKNDLGRVNFYINKDEWITFITSPIVIESKNSQWSNELTYWTSYIRINNSVYNEFKYNFFVPDKFLRQNSRRSRSWESFHFVNPNLDIAIQFFSTHEKTYIMNKINETYIKNIKGQFLLWICNKDDLENITNKLQDLKLVIQIIEEKEEENLIAITTQFFDPFLGISNTPDTWDKLEYGIVKDILFKNKLNLKLPGKEYKGTLPSFFEDVTMGNNDNLSNIVTITERDYISGFPLLLNQRTIQVSRFKMIDNKNIKEITNKIKNFKKDINLEIEFNLVTKDMWPKPIYELTIYWTPLVNQSSEESYLYYKKMILDSFNELLPTSDDDKGYMKNTYDILHIAGEIGFENEDNDLSCP